MAERNCWLVLASSPFSVCSNIEIVDDMNFVLAPKKSDAFYRYNIVTNEWDVFVEYPQPDKFSYIAWQIAYNKTKNTIFIHDNSGKLIIYHMDTKTYEKIRHRTGIKNIPYIVSIDGDIHVIGGGHNNYHLLWNEERKNFDEIYEFKEWQKGNLGANLIYLSSSKQLLLFGGYDFYTETVYNSILTHSVGTTNWTQLTADLPVTMLDFGCIVTLDEKYVITFGGVQYYNDDEKTVNFIDDIWIFNLNTFKWTKSSIKCPEQETYIAVAMSNKTNDKLLVSGFIRSIDNISSIPEDIIELISNWYLIEFAHLFMMNDTQHWKVCIDDILQQ